jgi:hypothetical protein
VTVELEITQDVEIVQDVAQQIDGALDAGAILPEGAALGERRDSASTRAYVHPALTDRTVVRLAPDALGPAEDLTMEFLGFGIAAEPVRVGVIRQQALGFPAWALIHDPVNGHHALNLVKDIERLTRLATTKPGHAKEGFDQLAVQLAGAVPHFLPTYYEQAARAFLAAQNTTLAASCFGKAREAERAHGLAIDERAQGDSFLEFALAGALTAKALTEYARALAARVSPDAAYVQFRRICVERVASGLPPYTAMPTDLRRLAKAAGRDTAAEDAALACELLPLPATAKASAGFWNAYRAPLVRAAKIDTRVRGLLLTVLPSMPSEADNAADNLWLDILHDSGAMAALTDLADQIPAEARSADGVAGWLNRFAKHCNRYRGWRYRSHERDNHKLLDLVGRMAPRLLEENTALVLCQDGGSDIDLIDLCLTLGLPVADPGADFIVRLERWLSGSSARELSAFAADQRLRPYLYRAVDALARDEAGPRNQSSELAEAAQRLTGVPGLRSVLHDWLDDQAGELAAGGLVDFDEGLRLMNRVADPRILAVNPDAARRMVELRTAPFLGHALRAGILDEYGWPALELACARLAGLDPAADPKRPKSASAANQRSPFRRYNQEPGSWLLTAQWPYLVVQQEARAAVLDADGIRLEHTVSLPSGPNASNIYNVLLRYADDQLLVAWQGYPDSGGYWTGDPTRILEVELNYSPDSLELPWGGRTFGGRPLARPSAGWSAPGRVASDGADYWVLVQQNRVWQWTEFDPRTGALGRVSTPSFFAKPVTAAGEWQVRLDLATLRPAAPGTEDSPLGVSGGLVGFRSCVSPDGSQICEGVDGRTVLITRPGSGSARAGWLSAGQSGGRRRGNSGEQGSAIGVIDFPGTTQRQAILCPGDLQLVAEGGKRTAILTPGTQSGAYARGSWCVPPLAFWHFLTVRDTQGSTALRELTDETAGALLDRSRDLGYKRVLGLVEELLPEIANTRLRAGVAGYALVADGCVRQLAALRARFDAIDAESAALAAAAAAENRLHWDTKFERARKGLCPASQHSGTDTPTPDEAIRLLTELLVPQTSPTLSTKEVAARLRLDEYSVRGLWLETIQTGCALPALAFRAASPATMEPERAALLDFLELWDESGLSAPGTALRLLTVRAADSTRDSGGTLVETEHGRVLVLNLEERQDNGVTHWNAVEFSRDGQFGEIPGWTIMTDGCVVPWPGSHWLSAGALSEFCRKARALGPAPIRPEQAAELSLGSGLSEAEATVLLAGLPTDLLGYRELPPAEVRDLLGLSAAALRTAAKRFAGLDVWRKSRLLAVLLPQDADALWESGPRLDAAAASWTALKGRQAPLPESLIAAAEKVYSANIVQGLLNPAETSWLGGTPVLDASGANADGRRRYDFSSSHLAATALSLVWLAYHLPVGDPLRGQLPSAMALVRERLKAPDLKIRVGSSYSVPELVAALGHEAVKTGDSWRAGPLGLGENYLKQSGNTYAWCQVDLYPADLSGPDDPALTYFERSDEYTHARSRIVSLRLLLGGELPALLEHGLPQPGLEPHPAQDPTRSVPELVAEAADRFNLGPDAAALYLMLLALPDPSDRNTADWTGWKPARLKAARTELAGAKTADGDLVVSGSRVRAGRSLFLPGGWHALKPPYLPLETWKGPLLGVGPDGEAPLGVIVPRVPVAELFAAAWQRVRSGDGPRYHELTTGKKKK